MKDYSWDIKIADLLNDPWKTDSIKFEEKYLKNINIQEPWISWEVFLQWLNHNEILVELKNISFSCRYKCDKCLSEYNQKFFIEYEKNIKFVNPEEIEINEKIYDDTFPLNIKNKTINIEGIIEILVKNQEPIIKDCWKHKNQKEWENKKNQEKISSYKIDFSKLLKS